MKPRVLLDVDGVLADFITPVLTHLGIDLSTTTLTEDDLFALERHYPEAFQTFCTVKGFCRGLQTLPGAQEGVKRLQEVAQVYVVTAPFHANETWVHEREAWLHEHFGFAPHQIVHTSAKYLCVGDALIDDKPANLTKWLEHHPRGKAILWSQTYNAKSTVGNRARTWDDVLRLVAP